MPERLLTKLLLGVDWRRHKDSKGQTDEGKMTMGFCLGRVGGPGGSLAEVPQQ